MTECKFCFEILREPPRVTELKESSFWDRPKVTSAFRKLIKRAGDDLDILVGEVFVFSPSEGTHGMFVHDPEEGLAIYLSPCLDEHSQAHVDYIVAHEFGHAAGLDDLEDNTSNLLSHGRLNDQKIITLEQIKTIVSSPHNLPDVRHLFHRRADKRG